MIEYKQVRLPRDILIDYLVFFLLLVTFTHKAKATECNFLQQLSPYQKQVAYDAYHTGLLHDLELTTVAIAWKESRLGIYKIRYGAKEEDQSFGVMHTVAKWKTKGMNAFNKGVWIQSMIENDAKSLGVGVQDLLYWKKRSKGDWRKMVGRYNGGNEPNYTYTKSISTIIQQLKFCDF